MDKGIILVVEGDLNYLKRCSDVLGSAGYIIVIEKDSKAELAAIEKRLPDLDLLVLTSTGRKP